MRSSLQAARPSPGQAAPSLNGQAAQASGAQAARPGAYDEGDPELFSQRRYFRGLVRRDMAETVARLAAELQAYERAAADLSKEPDLRFVSGGARPEPGKDLRAAGFPPFFLDGLARMLYSTRLAAVGMEGFPPHVQAVAKVRLVAPPDPRKALQDALTRQDLLELYGQAIARQRKLVARYDDLAARLLPLSPNEGGGKEDLLQLQNIANELTAIDFYLALLPGYEQRWPDPQKARDELERASALAPRNALILAALAEAYLQLDRPVAGLERIGDALRFAPDFAKAHDIKGAILLRQRLPALAAQSFAKAVELAPGNAAYRVHRASASLLLEKEVDMCLDLQSACELGDCEGLQWARGSGRCPR